MINLYYNGDACEGYDDEYTVTIYHRTQEEANRTKDILRKFQDWITISERMPEEYCPNTGVHRTLSDEVLVTVDEDGERYVTKGFTRNGEWYALNGTNIIAWMPFPEPYKGEVHEAD